MSFGEASSLAKPVLYATCYGLNPIGNVPLHSTYIGLQSWMQPSSPRRKA
jgi:hypothetical protein